jgi:hypothetical protein
MKESERLQVRERASSRCEYCRLRQEHYSLWRHQIEHVIPVKHGGNDDLDNLALACIRCNLGKSSNLAGIDKNTGEMVRLYNPRTDEWQEHFEFFGAHIEGTSSIGRVSVDVLNMNERERLQLRRELLLNGELD